MSHYYGYHVERDPNGDRLVLGASVDRGPFIPQPEGMQPVGHWLHPDGCMEPKHRLPGRLRVLLARWCMGMQWVAYPARSGAGVTGRPKVVRCVAATQQGSVGPSPVGETRVIRERAVPLVNTPENW